MPVKPIRPDDAAVAKTEVFPDAVIEAWNEIIAKHYVNGHSNFTQLEIANHIALKMGLVPCEAQAKGGQDLDRALAVARTQIFEEHWLDVEPLYERYGWKVTYDKPAYNETYEANFTFTRRTRVITDYHREEG